MELAAFRSLVQDLSREIPAEFFDGVAAVDVSPRVVPHPLRADVYTLGECIPFHIGTDEVLSRVVLYHGSFRALAAGQEDFEWERETHETLLHELRHHLEWRAGSEELETYDEAVEQNLRRLDGEPFDPVFYRDGERVEEGLYRVEDCIFLERVVARVPPTAEFGWRGVQYRAALPDVSLPAYVIVGGLGDAPSGDVCLVFLQKPRLRDLFSPRAAVTEIEVDARPVD
jgi:hypothetical protein